MNKYISFKSTHFYCDANSFEYKKIKYREGDKKRHEIITNLLSILLTEYIKVIYFYVVNILS